MHVLSESTPFSWAFQAGGGQLVSAVGAVISPLEMMAQLGWLAMKEVDGGGAEKRRTVGRKKVVDKSNDQQLPNLSNCRSLIIEWCDVASHLILS